MARKDKNDNAVYRKLLSLDFAEPWDCYTDNEMVNAVLGHASKRETGQRGFPDQIYVNERERLLILVEVKAHTSKHESKSRTLPDKFAVDGVLHYLSMFLPDNIDDQRSRGYFSSWKIVGVAISGDIDDAYNHRVSTFALQDGCLRDHAGIRDLLDEEGYLNLFDYSAGMEIVESISVSSRKINRWLRSIDSQKRPILLSALMICLYPTKGLCNDFKANYASWSARTIVNNIPLTVKEVLADEGIPRRKIDVIVNELAFIDTDNDLNNSEERLLIRILDELEHVVIPLFSKRSNFDIVGKFYEEFLRYAGVSNVKKGIVLTPRHITELFTELIDLKYNDVVVDFACGTGSFLISAMNKILSMIEESDIADKKALRDNVKRNQLIGFEKNATMYVCALSNMMFHGDGKSNLLFCDCFSSEAQGMLDELERKGVKPTVGFINPPYGGKDNRDNPTKKEIQFLTHMLDRVSRFGVIIAPLSTFFKDGAIRNEIVKRHTLKYVINMPRDLFMPNAATATAIAVFETNRPQGSQEVVFAELLDDGLVLSKAKGRTDALGRWPSIKTRLLREIRSPENCADGHHMVKCPVSEDDEWMIQAHRSIDYSCLTTASFVDSIKGRLVYIAKRDLCLLDEDIDEVSLLEALTDYYGNFVREYRPEPVDTSTWREFAFGDVFHRSNGCRLTKSDMTPGATNYLGAIKTNNGVRDHIGEDPLFPGGSVTVNYNGSVAEAFYQSEPYWPSDDVYTLTLKDDSVDLDANLGLFLATLIKMHKQNYDYGRKWNSTKMEASLIKLPVDGEGRPDWEFMKSFMERLPYTDLLR